MPHDCANSVWCWLHEWELARLSRLKDRMETAENELLRLGVLIQSIRKPTATLVAN